MKKNRDHNQFNSLENGTRRWTVLLENLDGPVMYSYLDAMFSESDRYGITAFKTEPEVIRDFDFMYCAGGEL